MNKLLITICARGGSKGIPGKNIRLLNGVPLISYSINIAKEFVRAFDADIALSTDSEDIKNTAAQFGLATEYVRPEHTATDAAGKMETISDVLLYEERLRSKKYDYIMDLDITSPMRTIADLNKGFEMLRDNMNALNLFSVSPANRNPYFNMVEQHENGFYSLVKKLPGHILSRQQAPKVYDMNASFYFYRRTFFEQGCQSAITDKSLIYVVPHICFDLDHPVDFDFMEYLIVNKKLDFEF